MGVARVRGQLLQARLDYLREAHGSAELARVLGALHASDRECLRALTREGWFPFELLIRLDHVLARLLGNGEARFFEELGRASARHRTEWLGEHAALVNVHAFLSRVADEHHRFHDFGRAAYRRSGFTSGELSFWDYPLVDASFCAASRGYFLGVLELLTGHAARVEEVTCQCHGARACTYHLRWRRVGIAPAGEGD